MKYEGGEEAKTTEATGSEEAPQTAPEAKPEV